MAIGPHLQVRKVDLFLFFGSKPWSETLNLVTSNSVCGRKFKCFAQDSDLHIFLGHVEFLRQKATSNPFPPRGQIMLTTLLLNFQNFRQPWKSSIAADP